MAAISDVVRENLSPKALQVLERALAYRELGLRLTRGVEDSRNHAYGENNDVSATADGQGFIVDLMIDDSALAGYSVEDLEDLISDVMIEASAAGQAEGNRLCKQAESAVAELLGD